MTSAESSVHVASQLARERAAASMLRTRLAAEEEATYELRLQLSLIDAEREQEGERLRRRRKCPLMVDHTSR